MEVYGWHWLLQNILNTDFLQFLPPKTKQTDLKHAIAVAPSINTITFQQTQFTWYSFKKKLSLVVKYEAYENSTSMVF